MKIYTRGSTRKTQKLTKNLVKFCAENLMSSRLMESISIRVEFHQGPLDGVNDIEGDCFYEDDHDYRPKEFVVRVCDNLRLGKKLRTVCHEMVHVAQFAKGDMRYITKPARFTKFQGVLYPDELEYWDSPWEIEAFGREPGLYTRWIDSRGYAKNEIFDTRHLDDPVSQEEIDFVSS